jgi:hypothetical protein
MTGDQSRKLKVGSSRIKQFFFALVVSERVRRGYLNRRRLSATEAKTFVIIFPFAFSPPATQQRNVLPKQPGYRQDRCQLPRVGLHHVLFRLESQLG